jgi:membrane-bound metal-dependent hydrolase YbcI (DUF457 family)
MLFVLISILGLKFKIADCGNYSEDRGFTASLFPESAFCLKLMEAAFFLLYRL